MPTARYCAAAAGIIALTCAAAHIAAAQQSTPPPTDAPATAPPAAPTPPAAPPVPAVAPAPAPPLPAPPPPGTYLFQNPDLPADNRIDDLLTHMTIDEKIACLGTNPRVPRLGVDGTGQMEGLHGLAVGGPARWARFSPATPTTFPQSIGLGETWDAELLHEVGAAEGYEARYIAQSADYQPPANAVGPNGRPYSFPPRTGLVIRTPNADLGRDPRWGRTEECYGEDPYFNGTMVVQMVRGLQGDDPHYWQAAALLKHFLANSNEDGRDHSSSNFDDQLFREYYSVPFRMGIEEGGARAFMASYNAVNGVPSAINPYLKHIAVEEWGQDGIICTDGGAMHQLVTAHKVEPDDAHAVADCVKAGINQFLDRYQQGAHDAVQSGLLSEKDIDAALRGPFRVMIKLGMLDPVDRNQYSRIGAAGELAPWTTDANKALARRATRESIVLLKNDHDLLPLDRGKIHSIAVLGPRANKVYFDWYSGTPAYAVTPVDGIRAAAGRGVTVNDAAGDDIAAAVAAARSADVAVVCVGNHPTGGDNSKWATVSTPSEGREAVDRQSIDLEPSQEALIRQVAAVNPRTVVVLISSFPYTITWEQDHAPAILHMAHNSQEEGNGLADVLFGDYDPAGRLVQTWPRSLDQLPAMMDYNIRDGRTYMYFRGAPLFPFGYGLSYTTFAYANLRTSAEDILDGGSVDVSVDVRNTGARAGDEVVQLYTHHPRSVVPRPAEQLAGFQRVSLKPGETKTVTFHLRADQLAYWDTARRHFVVEGDQVELRVGSSSADIKLRKHILVRS